jgi:hypothetical protein
MKIKDEALTDKIELKCILNGKSFDCTNDNFFICSDCKLKKGKNK